MKKKEEIFQPTLLCKRPTKDCLTQQLLKAMAEKDKGDDKQRHSSLSHTESSHKCLSHSFLYLNVYLLCFWITERSLTSWPLCLLPSEQRSPRWSLERMQQQQLRLDSAWLDSSLGMTTTKYRKPGASDNRDLFSPISGDLKTEVKEAAGPCSLWEAGRVLLCHPFVCSSMIFLHPSPQLVDSACLHTFTNCFAFCSHFPLL